VLFCFVFAGFVFAGFTFACFTFACFVFACFVADVVAVVAVVPVVPVVVVVAHGPIVSPCAMCAGSALTLTVIVTNGFFFECVW
jgi:hypothetical protein